MRVPGPRSRIILEMFRRPRSMRRAVVSLFALSIILALSFLMAYESAIASYYRGESNFLTAILKPGPSLARSTMSADKLFRIFNLLLTKEGPSGLDRSHLERLGKIAAPLVVVLRSDEDIIYVSKDLSAEDLSSLPRFGSLEQSASSADEEEKYYAIRQLDFWGPRGERESFMILREPLARDPHLPYSRQLGLIAALFLLAADGAVGVYFTIRITTSLRGLEASARRMGSGDLETPVSSTGMPFTEIASAFAVLESMRAEIADLVKRERGREQERRELIANLSHDLRTPLAALRGYVDGLREGIADTPEKADRYLAVIADKTALLERMTGELLLLSTLDGATSPPIRVTMNLASFLESGLEELRLSHESEGVRFELVVPRREVLEVRADPSQLQRVVENVVANALRYGGSASPLVRFSLESLPDATRLVIEDNGKGVPEADLEVIFERFRRLDPERSGGGSGLGLAIARKLLEANGGTIKALRSPLGGLRIIITLPRADQGPSEEKKA